jgi:hypothetical protein
MSIDPRNLPASSLICEISSLSGINRGPYDGSKILVTGRKDLHSGDP